MFSQCQVCLQTSVKTLNVMLWGLSCYLSDLGPGIYSLNSPCIYRQCFRLGAGGRGSLVVLQHLQRNDNVLQNDHIFWWGSPEGAKSSRGQGSLSALCQLGMDRQYDSPLDGGWTEFHNLAGDLFCSITISESEHMLNTTDWLASRVQMKVIRCLLFKLTSTLNSYPKWV